MRPQTWHGIRGSGPEGSGATGATGCVGTGGEGGGPTRDDGGVLSSGRYESSLAGTGDAAPAGSGDGEREDLEECSCCCRLPENKDYFKIQEAFGFHINLHLNIEDKEDKTLIT